MPLAQTDFSQPFWKIPSLNFRTKMRLLRDALQGISTMHDQGIMHRDITRRNMLVLSIQPPQAIICDYGKATSEQKPTFTFLGPVGTLAPEVGNGSSYSNKIDLWAWAYAIAEVLGYHYTENLKITPKRLADIHIHLDSYSATSTIPEEKNLIQLLLRLLAWNPDIRMSAKEALSHSCWGLLKEPEDSSHELLGTGESQSKKPRTESWIVNHNKPLTMCLNFSETERLGEVKEANRYSSWHLHWLTI